MFIIRQLIKLIRLLHQNEGAFLLAFGFSLGIFTGFCGWVSALGVTSALIALFFRVQLGAFFLGSAFFALVSLPLIPTFHKVGKFLLEMEALKPLWTTMYEHPIFHWLKFNYTITAGATLVSLVVFPIVFIMAYTLVIKYQEKVLTRLKQTRPYKAFMKSSLVLLYIKYLDQIEA
ncbi:MAG: TIGR03546 family protein [Bdellovibrionaceae bacterium]|nr:TIGR03546 family protein [Pseudobdellovibrionaceae bacterium]